MLDPHDPTLLPATLFHAPCGTYGAPYVAWLALAWNSAGVSTAVPGARHSEGRKDAVAYPGDAR
jgi:hypothetical protein